MALSTEYIQETERRLGAFSANLPAVFSESLARESDGLEDAAVHLWIEEGLDLAGHSLRSWEAAEDYFRAGIKVLPTVDSATFRAWAASGKDLAEMSAAIAIAYFRASPNALPHLNSIQIGEWETLGKRLYKGTWKSISLAGEFFTGSPALLQSMSLGEVTRLARVIEGISERSADLAMACLESSIHAFNAMERGDRRAFLDFAAAIAESSWPESNLYFQRGSDLLRQVSSEERARYLDLAARVARRIGRQVFTMFADGANSLRDVDPIYHGRLIELADRLVGLSPQAAMSFLRALPTVFTRLKIYEVEEWHAAGLDILRDSIEGGEAYFRLESGKAEQMISSLSARVDLTHVSDLLSLYGKALTGSNVSVHPVTALEEKGIGWVSERGPSTEGTSIYLPEYIEDFGSKPENFAIYKVYATHQAAHLEFGSFLFDFDRNGPVFETKRHDYEQGQRTSGRLTKTEWLTDMERFFDLFPERQLAADLFTLTEDARVDAYVGREYSGIRKAMLSVQEGELNKRPAVRELPLREAFVENLIRASLGGTATLDFPKALMGILGGAIQVLEQTREASAAVEDAAEATLRLYETAEKIPNLPAEAMQNVDWEQVSQDDLEKMMEEMGEGQGEGLDQLPEGEEEEYHGADQVDFRGDFKPEMVQLLMKLRLEQGDDGDAPAPLTAEQLKELLEKSVEIDTTDMNDIDLDSAIETFLENMEREAGSPTDDDANPSDAMTDEPEPIVEVPPEVKTFYYDEWDFRAVDYRPRWCAVRERVQQEGEVDYFERVLHEHAALVSETQRQFELLRPEVFRKIKRLEDGEDVDLDAAIEFLVSKKAGHGDIPKIYWRRNKVERDVAVAFLLDMSASTDEEIEKRRPKKDDDDFVDDPRKYFAWLAQRRSQQILAPPKRIIDLEKESLVLLTRALEAIGDRYGIYGFSGYGRDNVEYYVIKDLNEPFGDQVRRRIDKMSPIRSTRMGPAIRHTTAKLEESDARARILFLVSDGRPQDHGYGRDRTEKEYAIHDTHKALVEAKHKGIVPFALTVDKEGHDYLGQMCGDMGYEIVSDIEILPSRLPTLYRKLTE